MTSIPKYAMWAGKRVRVTDIRGDSFHIIDHQDAKRIVHRSKITPVKQPKTKPSKTFTPPQYKGPPQQLQLPFGKRDNKPKTKKENRDEAVGQAAVGGLGVAQSIHTHGEAKSLQSRAKSEVKLHTMAGHKAAQEYRSRRGQEIRNAMDKPSYKVTEVKRGPAAETKTVQPWKHQPVPRPDPPKGLFTQSAQNSARYHDTQAWRAKRAERITGNLKNANKALGVAAAGTVVYGAHKYNKNKIKKNDPFNLSKSVPPKPVKFPGSDEEWAAAHAKAQERRAAQAAEKAGKQTKVAAHSVKKIPFTAHINRNQAINFGLATTAAVGAFGALHHQTKKPVIKRDSKKNVALGAAGGAATTEAAWVAGGQTAKARIKVLRNRQGMTPAQEDIWAKHKQAAGLAPGEKPKGSTPAHVKDKIFTKYPKELPGWKAQRVLGYKNRNSIYAGALVAGAAAGAAYGHHRSKVSKANPVASVLRSARGTSVRYTTTSAEGTTRVKARSGGWFAKPKSSAVAGGGLTDAGKFTVAVGAVGTAGTAGYIHNKHYVRRNAKPQTVKVKVKKGYPMNDPFEVSKASPLSSSLFRGAIKADGAARKTVQAIKPAANTVKVNAKVGGAIATNGFKGMSKPAKIATVGGGTAAVGGAGYMAAKPKPAFAKSADPFEISKKKVEDISAGRLASGAAFGPIHGLVAGKKGHKLKAAGYELGGGLIAGPVGAGVGTNFAHKAGHYKPLKKKNVSKAIRIPMPGKTLKTAEDAQKGLGPGIKYLGPRKPGTQSHLPEIKKAWGDLPEAASVAGKAKKLDALGNAQTKITRPEKRAWHTSGSNTGNAKITVSKPINKPAWGTKP